MNTEHQSPTSGENTRKTERLPEKAAVTADALLHATADWLAEHPDADYDALSSGPLGEALTKAELLELAGDGEAQANLCRGLRRCANACPTSGFSDESAQQNDSEGDHA